MIKIMGRFIVVLMLCSLVQVKAAGNFIEIKGTQFVDSTGQEIFLKGFGLGGWLVPEGYMLHIPGFGSPTDIQNKISALIGPTAADQFWQKYRHNYVNKKDIEQIAAWGFNSLRLPFNYRLLSPKDQPGVYLETGFAVIDTLIEWCRASNIRLILDMHCAPGGQNAGNISDSDGIEARLWTESANQDRTVDLWREIAHRYAREDVIVGYDLLNEPVLPSGYDGRDLRALYIRITSAIRQVDTTHIVFVEGNWYATDFSYLTPQWDTKLSYSFHDYWSPSQLSSIQQYLTIRQTYGVPIWLGESGENSNTWFYRMIKIFDEKDIPWSWWTHKKLETITSPYSAKTNPLYEQVLAYWRGEGPKPSQAAAETGLFAMAESLSIDKCVYLPDVKETLTDPNHGLQNLPYVNHTVPGVIAAVDYDLGQNGYGSYDTDFENDGSGAAWNTGYSYRNDGVDIQLSDDSDGFPYSVGWLAQNEWMSYTFKVSLADTFDISVRLAAPTSSGQYILLIDQKNIAKAQNVASTGGWYNWKDTNYGSVYLSAGKHVLKFKCLSAGFNLERFDFKGRHTSGGIIDNKPLPKSMILYPNFPNPFNPGTHLKYEIPSSGFISVNLYNVNGAFVRSLYKGKKEAGVHIQSVVATGLSSGVYFYKITFKASEGLLSNSKSARMILLK